MNLISNVAIIVIPNWVKAATLSILGLLSVIYLGLSIFGIYDNSRPGWVEAGTYLLGILLPFILVGLILGFGQSGVEALLRRNASFLTNSLPNLMALLGDPEGPLRDHKSRPAPEAPLPNIKIQAAPNSSIANYVVTIDEQFAQRLDGHLRERTLLFRIELNALKANINVMLPGSQAPRNIAEIFPHSISGAKNEGYWFADSTVRRTIDGCEYCAIVGSKKLDDDFLINPVKRLQFGQDLMLFLRSMLHEQPAMFETRQADSA